MLTLIITMSILVRELLRSLGLLSLTTHEDRIRIDEEIDRITGKYCDEGVKELMEDEFIAIVKKLLRGEKKRSR